MAEPKETPETFKMCPILMAGAMASESVHKYASCLGDNCEWFENGCPAHHRLAPEFALRRDELLVKFRANEISRSEAIELNDIFVNERRIAQKRGDNSALAIIGLGLALLANKL